MGERVTGHDQPRPAARRGNRRSSVGVEPLRLQPRTIGRLEPRSSLEAQHREPCRDELGADPGIRDVDVDDQWIGCRNEGVEPRPPGVPRCSRVARVAMHDGGAIRSRANELDERAPTADPRPNPCRGRVLLRVRVEEHVRIWLRFQVDQELARIGGAGAALHGSLALMHRPPTSSSVQCPA